MITLIAILVWVLFACGIYLILEKSLIRILIGFSLLTHAANLLLISVSGSPLGKEAPIVTDSSYINSVDPLPQALILTAIVIGFGVTVYLVVMMYKLFTTHHTTDASEMFNDD